MQKLICLLAVLLIPALSVNLNAQCDTTLEFGITTGGFTNFPASKDYLDKYMSGFYLAPYVRSGNHEFALGINMPLKTSAIYFSDDKISPRPGAIAAYKFYFADIYGREKFFIHYMFQYLRYKDDYNVTFGNNPVPETRTETDFYINNAIGLGYNLFFDIEGRFGLYYILDYMISQKSFGLHGASTSNDAWISSFSWNNVSTQIGFSFRLKRIR